MAGARWAGAGSSSEVVGAWGGVGTADAREAVVTTGVGRGGGGGLGVAWAQGRGIGEERKEEDGPGIYRPYPFTPGAIPPSGVKVLYPRCVLPTGSKGFLLAGHKTAAHLYSRMGFPPGSKGGLQFRFPPVLSNSLVKYNRNAIVFC